VRLGLRHPWLRTFLNGATTLAQSGIGSHRLVGRSLRIAQMLEAVIGNPFSKTVRSHGWRSPSAPWMGLSVFWKESPNSCFPVI